MISLINNLFTCFVSSKAQYLESKTGVIKNINNNNNVISKRE